MEHYREDRYDRRIGESYAAVEKTNFYDAIYSPAVLWLDAAVIGIVMLVGIAVNNSIILVDRINQLKQSGMELTDAIVESGQQRIRPILMTTLTTILALLPMTFGFGEGASLRSPMAIAVIGGLVTSTVMSLMVIPCVYYVFEKMKRGK